MQGLGSSQLAEHLVNEINKGPCYVKEVAHPKFDMEKKRVHLPAPKAPYEVGQAAPAAAALTAAALTAAALFLYCSERDGEKVEEPRSMDSRRLAPELPPLAI